MKHAFFFILFAVLCGAASAQTPVVTIVNETGQTIEYLYTSSNQTDSWEDDVLGRNVLTNGSSFKITLPETGTYDFKGTDTDKDSYYKWNIIIRGNTTITLTAEDFKPDDSRPIGEIPYVFSDSPAPGSTWMTVVNNTNFEIYYLYVSLSDSDGWYSDILKDDTLEKGKQVTVRLPRPGTWDVKAVDKLEHDYTKMELIVTAGANRVVIQQADMD